jgi:hypothetical protein
MKSIFIFLLLFISVVASGTTLNETRTVKRLFSEGTKTGGFYTVEGLPQCLYQIMYINLETDAGKAQFSLLLSAKAASQKIVRIDYSVHPTNGHCDLSGIHVE